MGRARLAVAVRLYLGRELHVGKKMSGEYADVLLNR